MKKTGTEYGNLVSAKMKLLLELLIVRVPSEQ